MKTIKLLMITLIMSSLFACTEKAETPNEQASDEIIKVAVVEESLYDRLGGADGISSIVDDIIAQHLKNPVVSEQFTYLANDPKKMEMVKVHLRDFLGMGTGGSEQYTGKSVPDAHQGMNVSTEEFVSAVDDILLVLNDHGVSDQTKKDMLYILYSFKGQVIGL